MFMVTKLSSKSKSPNDTDDLGQGVFSASGLRGHLVTRWQDKAQYQLKIEPIDPREDAMFALVNGNAPRPFSINIRVLDSSGFALCGKEILLPFDPSKAAQLNGPLPKKKADADQVLSARQADLKRLQAQEQDRARGKDVFQNIAGTDGKVEALWAQGVLPCSPDQYQRFDYWDMSTNFPTIAEQQQLLNRKSGPTRQEAAKEREAAQHKAAKRAALAFYVEGDDRVTGYEPARAMLITGPGRSFFIDRKSDQAIAANWAANSSLVHFSCDQHAVCALKRAGTAAVVVGRMNE
jgi:hypothetical protein